jgi:hypothetical protein
MGRIGGSPDFEFDEPEASDVHCVMAARQDGVRLYVAPSVNNIYVNNQRIYTVELPHTGESGEITEMIALQEISEQTAVALE